MSRAVFMLLMALTPMEHLTLAGDSSLTIYNQDFAVVRQTVPLDLEQGINNLLFTEITAHVEPESVMLRDPEGRYRLQVLEQNYRSDPLSQELLLNLFEGKTIDFLVSLPDRSQQVVQGRIIRSGYVPHQAAWREYGQQYYATQMAYMQGGASQPIIEVDGKQRFSLPGQPLFPALGDDTILKPTLSWLLESDRSGRLDAELSYITGGMRWRADYNLVAPETGDAVDLVGWVTIDNQSGKLFESARIKLMAGDVAKIQPAGTRAEYGARDTALQSRMGAPVTEKVFDEYHLYSLQRPTTLHDRETKQVEFVRAAGVQSERLYVYDGAWIDPDLYRGWRYENIRQSPDYGTQSNPKIWVMREIRNSHENKLGLPLPKGRLRFYRRDVDGQVEFTGENVIDHTPKDETIRVYTGNSFDLAGERKRTNYVVNDPERWLDESFEITVRNHKKEPVEVRVVEHLYRWTNWEIKLASHVPIKTDGQTVEFRVRIAPDGEQKIQYTAHYSW
ncbi:MAG: DUF4139 domain-containing protein [Candidatus Polarisedimenticolia bacterium]